MFSFRMPDHRNKRTKEPHTFLPFRLPLISSLTISSSPSAASFPLLHLLLNFLSNAENLFALCCPFRVQFFAHALAFGCEAGNACATSDSDQVFRRLMSLTSRRSPSAMQNPLFVTIRDSCLQCIEAPTADAVRNLTDIVSAADTAVLAPIQKYILFPLQQILSKGHADPIR